MIQQLICAVMFVFVSSTAFAKDCQKSNWWQPEVILDAPEDLARFISIENDGTLVTLQNKTDKSLFLVYKDKKVYRLVKNKVYKRVKVKSKEKWMKIQHDLPADESTQEIKKADAAYLILSKEDFKKFSTSPEKDSRFFFEQVDKCGPDRLPGRPDARINFRFTMTYNKESEVINGQAVLLPNKKYDPTVSCCPK